MDRVELNSANDYDDRTTAAVKSVLVELGQTLGSFEGKFAVIGGAVPWLLLSQAEMPHVGTADVDLALHAEALGDGEYARLVDMLRRQGYRQAPELRRFQLARTVPANDGGPTIDVVVDFLHGLQGGSPISSITAVSPNGETTDFKESTGSGGRDSRS